MRICVFSLVLVGWLAVAARSDGPAVNATVELDVSEVPELKAWGEDAKKLATEWYPRMCNLLPSKDFSPAKKFTIKIEKEKPGVADTYAGTIRIAASWVEKHPEDTGMVIHEMVHVIQAYPRPEPGWLTEGIADYCRFAIFEGKPISFFPKGSEKQGYKQSYRVTAGFLLWLESDRAPGIVSKLNTAMRQRKYSDEIFKTATGDSLDTLWEAYYKSR